MLVTVSFVGGPLLRAVQTGEVSVREQAMRASAMIQPPEVLAAFTAGLQDASADIRMVASGGSMKAPAIPEEVVPALVEALRGALTQIVERLGLPAAPGPESVAG